MDVARQRGYLIDLELEEELFTPFRGAPEEFVAFQEALLGSVEETGTSRLSGV